MQLPPGETASNTGFKYGRKWTIQYTRPDDNQNENNTSITIIIKRNTILNVS
jgi:hypothetical protein